MATDGFALSRRQRSTAVEHINYMLGWQQLLAEQGFGQFIERCGIEAANCLTDGRRAIRAVTEKNKGAKKKTTPKVHIGLVPLGGYSKRCSGRLRTCPAAPGGSPEPY